MRILVAIDVDQDWRENADLTFDEVIGQISEDVKGCGRVAAAADVTESYGFVLDAVSVAAEDDSWTTERIREEASIAVERLSEGRTSPVYTETRERVSTFGALVVGDVIVHEGHGTEYEVTQIEDQGEGWRLFDLYDGNGTTYASSHRDDQRVIKREKTSV